jgi:DNA polymerase-3 subunit epsilon
MVPRRTAVVICFDTETTGLDPLEARIVELGIARGGEACVHRTTRRYNPGLPIPPDCTAIHGISDADVADKPAFADAAGQVLRWLMGSHDEGHEVAAYNGLAYDGPILNAELERAGCPARLDLGIVLDPLVFARWHLRHERSRRLTDLCALLGVEFRGPAHNAGADAEATILLAERMRSMGLIPRDPAEALHIQAKLAAYIDSELHTFGTALYLDRQDGGLRVGIGRHTGTPLARVDPGWIKWALKNVTLTERARQALTS